MSELAVSQAVPVHVPRQAENDTQAINLWLHGKAEKTARAYRNQIQRFIQYVDKPLRFVTLGDVQAYQDHLEQSGMKVSSQNTHLMAVKSLFSFCQRIGYVQFNVGGAVQGQPEKDTLAERILSESEVQAMIHLEENPRNKAMLRFLYCTGARASEISDLRFRDFSEAEEGAVVTLYGKGGKTRYVLIPQSVWADIQGLHSSPGPDTPVFLSRKKGQPVSRVSIWRIVRAAAKRAGIQKEVSPHFMRHSCASHSLDRGAPIHVVQSTLGHSNLATTGRYTHVKPKQSAGQWLAI